MSDDVISLVEAMDRCWLESRFTDLGSFLGDDVVVVAPGGGQRIEGRAAVVDSYREFMGRSEVLRFETSDRRVVRRESTAVVDYRWEMSWETDGTNYEGKGRDILVLARQDGSWQVIWRTQISD